MLIETTNLTYKKIPKGKIQAQSESIMKKIKLHFDVLSIAFVSPLEIKKLNKKYRKKDKVTDVLSFDYGDSGEIVLCQAQAQKQAKEKKHSVSKELTILLIHALLHLKGYDHEKIDKEAEIMEKKEREILHYLQEKS